MLFSLLWILLGLFSALLNAAAGISCLLSSVCSFRAPSSPRDSLLTVHSAPVYVKVGQLVSASPPSSQMRSSLIYSKQQGMLLICIRIHTVHYSFTVLAHIVAVLPALGPSGINVLHASNLLNNLTVLALALRYVMRTALSQTFSYLLVGFCFPQLCIVVHR